MMFMIATALVCALSVSLIIHPLMKDSHTRKVANIMCAILVLGSLGGYLTLGSPELPSNSAAYEKDPYRAQLRHLMYQLKFQPENPDLITKLGQLHFENGDLEKSIILFESAISIAPDHHNARHNLGALLFGVGMMMRSQGASDEQISPVWQQAFEIAPDDASYRETIEKNIKSLMTEEDNYGE